MSWKHLFAVIVGASAAVIQVGACSDVMDIYTAGIVFSKGEQIQTQNIELFCQDSLSYIKTCEKVSGNIGQKIIVGSFKEIPGDLVTIDSAWVEANALYLDVLYGGGCKVHRFNLYTSGIIVSDSADIIELYLSHDANGDNCKAIVSERLVFNLLNIPFENKSTLRIFAPGQSAVYTPEPLWIPAKVDGLICSYKIRSAYSENVMAYIGMYNGYSSTTTFAQILVIFDSSKQVPSTEEKVIAIKTEIQRLEKMDVISMTENQLTSIEAQLIKIKAGQYWTAEDTVLGFNQWFENDGINGVKSVYSNRGCGSGVDFEMPLKSIIMTTPVISLNAKGASQKSFRVIARNSKLELTGVPKMANNALVRIAEMNGRTIAAIKIPAGISHVTLDNSKMDELSNGCYMVSIIENGRIRQSTTLSILH